MRIKKGDQVEVVAGNDKGTRGEVLRVLPDKGRVVISGVRVVKKHQKPQQTGGRSRAQGGIIEFEAPIDISNVMLVCPDTGEPTRIGLRREVIDEETGKTKRVRYSKKSGNDID